MSFPEIRIKKVEPHQAEMLRSLAATTFIATYAAYNTPENMRSYVEQYFNIPRIKKELENPDIQYFMATLEDEVVGYLKLNEGEAQTESHFQDTLEIERIYVTHQHHGKGYGVALLSKAIEVGKIKALKSIWLGVWDQNEKAIAFYERNGFYRDGIHPFVLGDEPQRDYLMKLDL
ncbi:MAG: GNAT family N-acetyltransferase [Bacteroidota bacterium]